VFCSKCGAPIESGSGFCAQCGVAVGEDKAGSTPPPINVNVSIPAQQRVEKSGCIGKTLKFSLIIFVVLLILALLNGGQIGFTTAGLNDVNTATKIDPATNLPTGITATFTPNAPAVYTTFRISNAPPGTRVKSEWFYLENGQKIDAAEIEATELDQNASFHLSRPNNGFPRGQYEVKLYIDDEYNQSANFEIR